MSTQAEKGQSIVIPLRERQRLILTWDGGQSADAPPEVAARQVRSLVQALEGSHVGIYQRHIGGTIKAAQASKVLELGYAQQRRLEAGVDIMSVFVDECHKCGIQAWGSSRMNDAHHTYKGLNTDAYQTAFYKEHPELQLKEWDDSCQVSAQYDWNKPEVAKINLKVNGHEVAVDWEAGLTLPLVVLDHPSDNLHCHRQAVIDPGLLKKGHNTLTFRILQSEIQPPAYLKPEPCEVRKVELEITYEDETLPYWLRAQLPR